MSTHNSTQHIKFLIADYKSKVDQLISREYPDTGGQNLLQDALSYALSGSGKRFRPCITLLVANSLNAEQDASFSALAVELFHTASLIADDLPSMDNDSLRRSKPSVHKVFGEDVALLASYALIGEGYQNVLKNKEVLAGSLPDLSERTQIAIKALATNNGLRGAPSGQLLDLHPPQINKETLDLIFYQKTVIFFETAFLFGWLFGGGDLKEIEKIKKSSYHFGMAFQIYDDFCDLKQDQKRGGEINYPHALGVKYSLKELKSHIEQCDSFLANLNIKNETFQEMLHVLSGPLYA